MARVVYDGCRIVVDAARLDVDKLNDLAEKFKAEYIPTLNAFAFDRTVNSVLEIAKVENGIENYIENKVDLKALQDKIDNLERLVAEYGEQATDNETKD